MTTNVPRALICCIRSKRLTGSSRMGARLIALALLTTRSMPPKRSAVWAAAASTASASRMSPTIGSASPPAASISSAAREHGSRQLGVRLRGLRHQRDLGAVARGPERDREADPAAPAGHEHDTTLEAHAENLSRMQREDVGAELLEEARLVDARARAAAAPRSRARRTRRSCSTTSSGSSEQMKRLGAWSRLASATRSISIGSSMPSFCSGLSASAAQGWVLVIARSRSRS